MPGGIQLPEAAVAQLVEQRAFNPKRAGSIPAGGIRGRGGPQGRTGSAPAKLPIPFSSVLIRRLRPALLAASLILMLPVASAYAENLVVWGSSSAISVAPTAGGTSGKNIFTSATTNVGYPFGTAVDPSTGKIYWINSSDGTLYTGNLGGTGTPTMITDQGISNPYGLALDPLTQRLYWANDGTYDIRWITTDGTTGGILYGESGTPQASTPHAPVVDPAHNRIYWANKLRDGPQRRHDRLRETRRDRRRGPDHVAG